MQLRPELQADPSKDKIIYKKFYNWQMLCMLLQSQLLKFQLLLNKQKHKRTPRALQKIKKWPLTLVVGEVAGATEEIGPEVVVKVLGVEARISSTVKYVKMGQPRLNRGKAGDPDIQITLLLRVAEVIGDLGGKHTSVLTVIRALGRTD